MTCCRLATMSNSENNPAEVRPASQHDLVEKGSGFIPVPEVPDDWEPPSAALILEPATQPEPEAPSGDS